MLFLKKYVSKYWKLFFAAISCLMLEAACDLMQPTIMSKVIDVGVASGDMSYVLRMGGIMLLITAIGALAAIGRNILSSNVSQSFGKNLRADLYRKINSFSFEDIDKYDRASLVTRMTNDVTQLQNFVNGTMRIFVKAPLLCIGSFVMAFLLNARMALILAVVVPVVAFLIFISARVGYPLFKKVQTKLDRTNSVMREYLLGVRVVKAFNRFDYESERFEKANTDLASISTKAMRVMAVFTPGITLTVNIGIVLVLWLGGYRVNNGNMQVGQIIAFINYMTQILHALMMISFVFTAFVRARASTERIGEVMDQHKGIEVMEHPEEVPFARADVVFDEVSFSYAGNDVDPVLQQITFECRSGEMVGIIGSTGSGKSSLVNLIPRFYDTTSGSIRIGGIDIKQTDPRKLRQKIAVVPQKNVLFTGTIIENILWGKEDAGSQEVEEAAKAAQAHDFIISFPEGYNTRLGQGGVNLSGGQKQRISIARALVRKPEILILDDCTSAVDAITEKMIRETLKSMYKAMTCFVIAQRITSVMHADRIIVLDHGKIEGIGTHTELMNKCEVYQDIYRSQIDREGVAPGGEK